MEEVCIPSHSVPGKMYTVAIIDLDSDELVCECDGYQFRGTCSHLAEAKEQVCRWNDVDGPELQTVEQHECMVCPRCGRETEWTESDLE